MMQDVQNIKTVIYTHTYICVCVLDTLFIQSTDRTCINELSMFHHRALKEYLNLRNTTNICKCIKTFYHILSITNMFRSLCDHHQGGFTTALRTQQTVNLYISRTTQLYNECLRFSL
jgi:hypothetical protein